MNRSKLYDLVYDKADKLFKEYNPCKIQCKKEGLTCIKYKKAHKKCMLCCAGCKKHWSNKGCTIKCLYCKLYICGAVANKYKANTTFRKRLYKLCKIASKYVLLDGYYMTKRMTLARTNYDYSKRNKKELVSC